MSKLFLLTNMHTLDYTVELFENLAKHRVPVRLLWGIVPNEVHNTVT
jgi:hypothetical protein